MSGRKARKYIRISQSDLTKLSFSAVCAAVMSGVCHWIMTIMVKPTQTFSKKALVHFGTYALLSVSVLRGLSPLGLSISLFMSPVIWKYAGHVRQTSADVRQSTEGLQDILCCTPQIIASHL